MKPATFIKRFFLFLIIFTATFCTAFANGTIKVKPIHNRTQIEVSSFPKNATVLVVDEELNLISVGYTNNLGQATITIDKTLTKPVVVRTVHGDIQVSTKVTNNNTYENNSSTANIVKA